MDDLAENFKDVPAESIDAFIAQAELYLSGTVQLGLAADSKATTFSGAFGAIAAALIAAAATMLAATDPARFHGLIVGCTVAAAFVLAGVLCFARSAMPVDFHVAGHEPRLLAPSAADRTWMLRYVAASLQRRIDHNRGTLEASAAWTKRGIAFVILAVLFGIELYFAG